MELEIRERRTVKEPEEIKMPVSPRDSTRRRPQAQRKDPEREFFEMTICAFQLNYPSCKSLLRVDRSRLFNECKAVHSSFHYWPEWIRMTLMRVVLNDRYMKKKDA